MTRQDEIKKIERRARSLLLDKDIPAHKQDLVRTIMANQKLKPEEKWRAIIELVQSCPDRKVVMHEESIQPQPVRKSNLNKRKPAPGGDAPEPTRAIFAPTETSFYVDRILGDYRHLKLFRKRYLVHRDNRLGVGLRKRLVPTANYIRVMEFIAGSQGLILSRLVEIMTGMLNDPAAVDPTVFNLLRLFRRWMTEVPFQNVPYRAVKWMERYHFDREFREYVTNFYSFLKMDAQGREQVIIEVERRLRSMEHLKKEDLLDGEPDNFRREKERRNLEREKEVYEYMMTLRSFLPLDEGQESLLSQRMVKEFNLDGIPGFLRMSLEALVFQRPFTQMDLDAYYQIGPPRVSADSWDYSEDFLKKVGKDPESLKQKMRDYLRKSLEPYETLSWMLQYEHAGQNLLARAADEQWRIIDRKHYDPKAVYSENYINYLDALVQYFKNMYLPLLDGTGIVFRDRGRDEHEGAIFSPGFFEGHLATFNAILKEMHYFRTNNPTLAVSRQEVQRIMKGASGPLALVERFIRSIGDCFYLMGKELQHVYNLHRLWTLNRPVLTDHEPERTSIRELPADGAERGRPIPYHDCVIVSVENGTALTRELSGNRVVEDSLKEGIYVRMNAFVYQVSHECLNQRVIRDLDEMKTLMKKIDGSRG